MSSDSTLRLPLTCSSLPNPENPVPLVAPSVEQLERIAAHAVNGGTAQQAEVHGRTNAILSRPGKSKRQVADEKRAEAEDHLQWTHWKNESPRGMDFPEGLVEQCRHSVPCYVATYLPQTSNSVRSKEEEFCQKFFGNWNYKQNLDSMTPEIVLVKDKWSIRITPEMMTIPPDVSNPKNLIKEYVFIRDNFNQSALKAALKCNVECSIHSIPLKREQSARLIKFGTTKRISGLKTWTLIVKGKVSKVASGNNAKDSPEVDSLVAAFNESGVAVAIVRRLDDCESPLDKYFRRVLLNVFVKGLFYHHDDIMGRETGSAWRRYIEDINTPFHPLPWMAIPTATTKRASLPVKTSFSSPRDLKCVMGSAIIEEFIYKQGVLTKINNKEAWYEVKTVAQKQLSAIASMAKLANHESPMASVLLMFLLGNQVPIDPASNLMELAKGYVPKKRSQLIAKYLEAVGLNKDQKDVWNHVFNSPHRIVMLQGPSGTGKTLTNAVVAVTYALLGHSVVVTAPTEESTVALQNKVKSQLITLGQIDHHVTEQLARGVIPISSTWTVDQAIELENSGHEVLKVPGPKVIITTCHDAARLSSWRFRPQAVIIDEAARALEPDLYIAMQLLPGHLLISSDHEPDNPIAVSAEHNTRYHNLARSGFERLVKTQGVPLLEFLSASSYCD